MARARNMDLIDELLEIRDRANRLIQDYRYSQHGSAAACLAVLADDDGKVWRDAGYVHRQLQRGGSHLGSKSYVGKLLSDLARNGDLECRSVPTGRQGPDEKHYRLPRGLKTGGFR